MKKPAAFEKDQKLTLYLMLAMMAVVLVFPLLKLALPQNTLVGVISGRIDVGLVAVCFAVAALLLKLAPQKEVIARIPWNTILMIAGAGMLIAVAVKAGTIEALSAWIGSNVPTPMVPLVLQLCRCFYEFLQLYNRCCSTGPVPVNSSAGGGHRLKSCRAVCLHGAWSPEQRHQPVFFRRQPDFRLCRK